MDMAGRSICIDPDATLNYIRRAGFVDATRRPPVVLPWLHSSNVARERFVYESLIQCSGLQAMSLRPLIWYLKMQPAEVNYILDRVVAEMPKDDSGIYSLV